MACNVYLRYIMEVYLREVKEMEPEKSSTSNLGVCHGIGDFWQARKEVTKKINFLYSSISQSDASRIILSLHGINHLDDKPDQECFCL